MVICVISILAGMVANSARTARERARQTNCLNNLRQFGAALVIYRADRHTNPKWLSNLYPDFVDNKSQYICRSDEREGASNDQQPGNKRFVDPPQNAFPGVADNETATSSGRNTDIKRCSYFYEFNGGPIPSGWSGRCADVNGDGTTSWGELKEHVLAGGCSESGCPIDSDYGGKRPSSSRLPIVRCYWHYKYGRVKGRKEGSSSTYTDPMVLNVAYEGNVYMSPLKWEDTTEPGD